MLFAAFGIIKQDGGCGHDSGLPVGHTSRVREIPAFGNVWISLLGEMPLVIQLEC